MKLALHALVLMLGACEDESVCRAACFSSLDVGLLQQAWPEGEYTLLARYDAHRQQYVRTCTFTLPGGADARCEDTRPEGLRSAMLSVGATVELHLPDAPARIELELHDPEGEMKSVVLAPAYDEDECCGQTRRNGSIIHALD